MLLTRGKNKQGNAQLGQMGREEITTALSSVFATPLKEEEEVGEKNETKLPKLFVVTDSQSI